MIVAALAAAAVVYVLVAYAVGGSLGAFVAASAALVISLLWLCALAASSGSAGDGEQASLPKRRGDSLSLGGVEAELSQALNSRRVYDHSLRPRLFRVAVALFSHRHAGAPAGPRAAYDAVGDRLWPLVDPSVKSLHETPRVQAAELGEVLSRLEELA